MTDNQTPEPEQQTPEEETPAPEQPDAPTPEKEDLRGNREAAKYRTQLREAQAEVERTRGLLEAAQSAVLAQAASDLRVQRSMQIRPEAVRELDPSGFFAPDGTVDTKALQQRLDAEFKERPYLFAKNLNGTLIIPSEGKSPDATRMTDNFETAFQPTIRR